MDERNLVRHRGFTIRLPADDLRRSGSSGVVWGRVWFEFGDVAFPAAGWDDAIDPAVLGWVREAFALTLGGPGTARLRFMDGPFEATFVAGATGAIAARCEARGGPSASYVVPREAFVEALLAAVLRLASAYAGCGWDAGELERYALALRRHAPEVG
jgi:hypothetical protein